MLVWLLLIAWPVCCRATTVVVLRTSHDIVIGTDGKSAARSAGGRAQPAVVGTKLIVVGDRIVGADAGTENILNDPSYSFAAIMGGVKSAVPADVPLSQVVQTLEAKLAAKFRGFDVVLKSGRIKEADVAPPHHTLVKYYVTGFEAGAPFVYTLEMDVDWDAPHLAGPVVTPQPARKNLSVTWTGGTERGIMELHDRASAVSRKAAMDMPDETQALQSDKDLTGPQLLRLGCGLLDIEVSRNPEYAAYPLTVISIPKSGAPKTVTYQRKCS